MAICELKLLWLTVEMLRQSFFFCLFSYDRDEETESETKIRMPQDEYDNMESAGKKSLNEKTFDHSWNTIDFNLIVFFFNMR